MQAQIYVAETPGDFERFRTLAEEYDRSLDADLRHSDLHAELSQLRATYQPPSAAFVAVRGETPAGCVAIHRLDETTAVVKTMYVRPDFRKTGLGRALLSAALDLARRRGFSRAVLDTQRDRLSAAYNLYRSIGFRECAPYRTVDYASPTYMELFLKTS